MHRLSLLLLLGMGIAAMTTQAAGSYRLLQTIPVAGDEGWDHPTVTPTLGDCMSRMAHTWS